MDNQESMLPRFVEKRKSLVVMRKIKAKITGAILSSGRYEGGKKNVIFISHEEFENGSNKVITVIYRLLQIFLKDHKKLPRKLSVHTDNCHR